MIRSARSQHAAPRRFSILLAGVALIVCLPFFVAPSLSAQAPTTITATIDAVLADAELARGTWGLSIRSLDRGDVLYERNADKLLLPASSLKVVTLAVVAERLGWTYTFPTRLYRTGTIKDGVLHGDLVVVGSGDPSVDDWDGAASAHFRNWAAVLKDLGISTITGRVIGDDNVFDDGDLGSGWAWDDVAASYSAGVSGLQFNENTAQLVITPGRVGETPTIEGRPLVAPLSLINRAMTDTSGPPLQVRPLSRSVSLEVVGTLPPGRGVVRNVAVANSTIYFAAALRAALQDNGIVVQGPAVDVDDLKEPIAETQLLGEFRSPPLSALATTMMRLSQNLFAESLLKTLSATTSGAASTAASVALVHDQLKSWGVPDSEAVIADGSGLSRYNLLTPRAQAIVMAHVYTDPALRDPFVAALPVAGESGTLERRMANTPAAGNVRAKTGSFSNARALTGFVRSAGGEMLVFSIMANNFNAPSSTIDHATDAIVVALTRFKR